MTWKEPIQYIFCTIKFFHHGDMGKMFSHLRSKQLWLTKISLNLDVIKEISKWLIYFVISISGPLFRMSRWGRGYQRERQMWRLSGAESIECEEGAGGACRQGNEGDAEDLFPRGGRPTGKNNRLK